MLIPPLRLLTARLPRSKFLTKMQQLGTATVHRVTIANSYMAAQSRRLPQKDEAVGTYFSLQKAKNRHRQLRGERLLNSRTA